MNATEMAPSLSMLRILAGSWVSQGIYVAAKLGIADLLGDRALSAAELAQSTGCNASALYRVLRALASVGIFSEDDAGGFHLTPMAEYLRSDAPGSLRAYAIMLGEPEHRRAWDAVLHSVRTGEPAFDAVFGVPHFQYMAQHPEFGRIFNKAMTSRSAQENDAVVTAYDFSRTKRVVDVGGGEGTLLTAILNANPRVRGVLFDQPHVIEAVRSMLGAQHASRCAFEAGSFFDAVPSGGDCYVVKKVILDWDDERARIILKNCRRAMAEQGRLLVIEPVVPPGNEPSFAKLLDLLMLVWTSGGRDRTEAEHRNLLTSAGFNTQRISPASPAISIIEAVPR